LSKTELAGVVGHQRQSFIMRRGFKWVNRFSVNPGARAVSYISVPISPVKILFLFLSSYLNFVISLIEQFRIIGFFEEGFFVCFVLLTKKSKRAPLSPPVLGPNHTAASAFCM